MAHIHYKGTGKVHSFRGLCLPGLDGQIKVSVQGSVGAVAWRITKFDLMPNFPGADDSEYVVKVFREQQTSVNPTVDFNNNQLLAAGYMNNHTGSTVYSLSQVVVFDNSLFSRNIFITVNDGSGDDNGCNYYIELEEVTLSATGKAQLALAAARRTLN